MPTPILACCFKTNEQRFSWFDFYWKLENECVLQRTEKLFDKMSNRTHNGCQLLSDLQIAYERMTWFMQMHIYRDTGIIEK